MTTRDTEPEEDGDQEYRVDSMDTEEDED